MSANFDFLQGQVEYQLFAPAVIEAKRTSKDPKSGIQQAKLYADCLEVKTLRRPIIFMSNGFETYIWDDLSAPQRKVSGIFSKADLEKLMSRRTQRKDLATIKVQDKITDRYYQKEAIQAVSDHIQKGHRRSLLVMATGSGKTRVSSSLTDVLSRSGYITNTLFLADRTALVRQAKDDYRNYLPDMSLCNLLSGKEDKNARIVFSTYPNMLNAIDTAKSDDGKKLFTPAHFDLIIVDEAHRSIFKKYRAIFEYFDAYLVGLTATPKSEVDRNTYDFFEMESGVPTYAYDYDTAVYQDKVFNTIQTDEFWESTDILTFEKVRIALRDLIKFIVDTGNHSLIYTNLADNILGVKEGDLLEPAYDFEDYKIKVNRYVEENKENIAIHKLRNNIPLTAADYGSLEQILTGKLGTKSDYERVFGDTPFGLLVRKIGKLEYDAAMRIFFEFIDDQSLKQTQIVFVKKIVDYIVQNGYIENMAELTKPPFDKPVSFMKLFDKGRQQRIIELVSKVKENAIRVVG